jgi:hypothetical protein
LAPESRHPCGPPATQSAVTPAPAALSPLDAKRFGVVVARAHAVSANQVPDILAFCERHDVELLIARCDEADPETLRALVDAGLTVRDTQVTYRAPLDAAASAPEIRTASWADRDAVAAVARRCFADFPSHYHADPRLPRRACRELYVDWALRSLASEEGDTVFVVEHEGRIVAFSSFTQSGDTVRWGLAATDPDARGRYQVMILRHAMAWGRTRGAHAIETSMPAARVRHRASLRCGLAAVGGSSTLHGWSDELAQARRRQLESDPAPLRTPASRARYPKPRGGRRRPRPS